SPSHSSAVGSAHDVDNYYAPSSPSNSGRKKFALFQQGLLKVGDKVRKDFDQRSADDILAKYQPAAAQFADEVQPAVELASSASESAPSEQVIAYYSPDNLTECSGMKLENEREQLVMLLRTLLAEAVNNREQSLVAHTREVMRCLQIFDNKGEKSVVEECLVEVLVRFYLENKDQQMKRFLQEFVILNAQDEKTDCLLRTLTGMYTRLPVSSMWQSAPAHLIAYARKTIERVFMAQIHALAFYPNLDADRHRDE
ncbi:hypothetical protein TELCIR_26339, partial [Teladorsagia circumcincta]